MNYYLVYITCPNIEEARTLGEKLVEERLAACVNIIPGMESIYRWEEKLQHDREVVLLTKTTEALAGSLTTRVKELHSYDVPCVIALPIEKGNPAFLEWIASQCK